MLTTPFIRSQIKPFSPSAAYDFLFDYRSGDQAVRNNLEVQRLSDNFTAYNQTIESFTLKHTLPANTLQSGAAYRARVRIGSVSGQWSQFSEWVIFWVLDSPTLTIDNIDYANQNRVYSQTVEFSASYSHANSELLSSYRYNLYSSNRQLIQSYSEKFSDGSSPLTQEIAGLQNGELYYIELKTISVNLQETSTGLILVRPFYITPKITSAITVENKADEGAVKVTANIIQIVGRLYDNDGNEIEKDLIEYVDNAKLDMNRPDYAKLVFDKGFETDTENFTMKLWCKNLPASFDRVFLTMLSEYGQLDFKSYNSRIHVLKHINRVSYPSHYVSNEYVFLPDKQFMIYVKSVNGAIDIEIKDGEAI